MLGLFICFRLTKAAAFFWQVKVYVALIFAEVSGRIARFDSVGSLFCDTVGFCYSALGR